MAMPGTYTATLSKEVNGVVTALDGPTSFTVAPIFESSLKGISYDAYKAYIADYNATQTQLSKVSNAFSKSMDKVKAMQVALSRANVAPGAMNTKLHALKQQLYDFEEKLQGNQSKEEIGERSKPTVNSHLGVARRGMSTTYGPTPLHKQNLEIAKGMLASLYTEIKTVASTTIPQLEKELQAMGAPYILGDGIE
jgi:chromosome segregation ATPase